MIKPRLSNTAVKRLKRLVGCLIVFVIASNMFGVIFSLDDKFHFVGGMIATATLIVIVAVVALLYLVLEWLFDG